MYSTEPSFIELGLQFGLYFFILWVGIYMAAMEASDWPREEPQIDLDAIEVQDSQQCPVPRMPSHNLERNKYTHPAAYEDRALPYRRLLDYRYANNLAYVKDRDQTWVRS